MKFPVTDYKHYNKSKKVPSGYRHILYRCIFHEAEGKKSNTQKPECYLNFAQ